MAQLETTSTHKNMELSFVDSGQLADFKLSDKENEESCVDNGRSPTGHNMVFMPAAGEV